MYYWLVAMVMLGAAELITADRRIRPRDGCELLPVLETIPSQLYPDNCTLTVPTYICAGFCKSTERPVRDLVRPRQTVALGLKDTVQMIHLKQYRCDCCSSSHNSTITVKANFALNCKDEVHRTETVIVQLPTSCGCMRCRERRLVPV